MSRRPRLTIRARLTFLYTCLFAVCGGLVVAVSYVLVARLEPVGQSQQAPAAFVARCRAAQLSPRLDDRILAKCTAYFQLQGAEHQRHATLSHLLGYSLVTLGVAVVLAAILSWVGAGRALRPVHSITAAARSASGHNLSTRVALTGPDDELRQLAETFDDMLDRLEAAFESQRRFIANASHELRTPLAVMRATVDVVLADPQRTTADLLEMANDIRTSVDHAEHLIAALLILARNEHGLTTRDHVDLAAVVEDTLDATDLDGVRLHAELAPARVSGDAVLLARLVANLLDNAVRHNVEGGDVWVSTETTGAESRLAVASSGRPISHEDAHHIFEPFYRLDHRTSHEGFGLGLTIVASIAQVHRGTATASPRDEGGLCVTVALPTATSCRAPAI